MTHPTVAIHLCTYNGAKYLDQQLKSIANQTLDDFTLVASDDGSTDETRAILIDAQHGVLAGRLKIVPGPGLGVNANFLSVAASDTPPGRYIAYCDQDDIWDADKLERAVTWLETISSSTPALYGTRTRLIDGSGKAIGHAPHFRRPPGFANALVQNMFGGNTMVFNASAWAALKASNPIDVVSHDWWTYIVTTAVGGTIRYEAEPSLSYRQHGANLVGANVSWQARLERVRQLSRHRFAGWNAKNIEALTPLRHRMTAENQRILAEFSAARAEPFPRNLRRLWKSGVYRQTRISDLGLWLATIAGRI